MKDSKRLICVLITIVLFANACSHRNTQVDNGVTPTVTPTNGASVTQKPTEEIQPTPVEEIKPTPIVEISPTPILQISPTPTLPVDENPEVSPTPPVTQKPSITEAPSLTPVPTEPAKEPTAPVPTITPIPTVTPVPTIPPFVANLGEATLIDIIGSNAGNSITSQIIKNPLKLQITQAELTNRLLELAPSLNTYNRKDHESYLWNYETTTDNVPVVNLTSYLRSEGRNNKDESMYLVEYSYSSEISEDPSSINIILNSGYDSMNNGKELVSQLLKGAMPEDFIKGLLHNEATSLTDKGTVNSYSVMNQRLYYDATKFYIDFRREETFPLKPAEKEAMTALKVYATANRPKLLYSAYRDGLLLHTEKFKEFPLDFSEFFLPLDPFHKFPGVKFIKEISYNVKQITSYTAEFDGYDMNGEFVSIIVTVDNANGEYAISKFRYYNSHKTVQDGTANNTKFNQAAEYYAPYLNQIMTLATYSKEELLENIAGDKISIIKDVTVAGQTIPCNVTITTSSDTVLEGSFTTYLDIEYTRP